MPAFIVSVGEKFIFCKKKMGDRALKVTDDDRGQLIDCEFIDFESHKQ